MLKKVEKYGNGKMYKILCFRIEVFQKNVYQCVFGVFSETIWDLIEIYWI